MLKAQLEVENADLREKIEELQGKLDHCARFNDAENIEAKAHVAALKDEIEGLRQALDACTSMAIASGESVGAEAHVGALKQQLKGWQQRVNDLEQALEKIVLPEFVARCDMLGLQEHDGIDIGVKAGALREAYKVLSTEPEEELLDVMKKPEVKEETDG